MRNGPRQFGAASQARRADTCRHRPRVVGYFVVGETHNRQATSTQDRLASPVVPFLACVNAPVDLNDQPHLMAVEVNDETVYDLLPAEMESMQPIGAEPLPEHPLSVGHPPA